MSLKAPLFRFWRSSTASPSMSSDNLVEVANTLQASDRQAGRQARRSRSLSPARNRSALRIDHSPQARIGLDAEVRSLKHAQRAQARTFCLQDCGSVHIEITCRLTESCRL